MLYLANRKRSFSQEAHKALLAADGYLYLNMAQEALEEIDSIAEEEQSLPEVLLARIRMLLHLKHWKTAEALSMIGLSRHPEEDEFTVQRAFALHQMQKGEQALEVLQAAPEWLRRTGILHYNLACYEARVGNLSTARHCMNAAIQMNAAIKKNARVDPDLSALWS